MIRWGPLGALALALAFGCSSRPTRPSAAAPVLTVIGISDFHGAFEPSVFRTESGEDVEVGGAPLMAAYIERLRARAPGPVLLLDAGDMYQGTLASNLAEGAPVIELYNHLGVAAAALGNHEFDFGPVGPDGVAREPGQDPRGALLLRVAEARFPFLAANMTDETGQVPEPFESMVMLELEGLKVAVIGVASEMTPTTTVAANLVGLTFHPPAPPVERLARAARADGAARVVVVLHGGSGCDDNSHPDGFESCQPGELHSLVTALPEGLVDLVLGGHTHREVAKVHRGTAVLQAAARAQGLVWAQLDPAAGARVYPPVRVCGQVVDGESGPSCEKRVVRASAGPVRTADFLGEPVAPDARVAELLAPALERVQSEKERRVGVEATESFWRAYDRESPLGNLVADAFRRAVTDAPIGLTNGGGLRADLPAGPVTYGEVFDALPFDNRLAVLTVDGAMIRRMVRLGLSGGHGALSWSGLTFEAEACEPKTILVGGAPLEDAARYRVVTNDYLSGGGSGFDALGIPGEAVEVLWERPIIRDVVSALFAKWGGPLSPADHYDEAAPRQRHRSTCDTVPRAGN